jgi:formiminoglutamase
MRFDGTALYREGRAPEAAEIARRRVLYFDPYHAAIRSEIARLKERHGVVVLYEAHSILSRVPRLFDGELPQFNIGAFGGRSCAKALVDNVAAACAPHGSCVVDGRFKGGWITRNYGDPANGVHAIQMELAMRGYLDEGGPRPPAWDENRAGPIQAVLRNVLTQCVAFATSSR